VPFHESSHFWLTNTSTGAYILTGAKMKFSTQSVVFLVTLGNAFAFAPSSQNVARAYSTQLQMAKDDSKRVVVTGLGVISGCGIGHEDFFQACLDGKSSVGQVTRFDASNYPCTIGSEVPDSMFDPNDFFTNPKNVKSNDRFTHFAVAAARQALKDAGLGDTPQTLENPERIGVMVGSAFGGMETFERETLKLASRPDRPKVRND
jgi:Beta-ketoacyl synthase, N-terminal domain